MKTKIQRHSSSEVHCALLLTPPLSTGPLSIHTSSTWCTSGMRLSCLSCTRRLLTKGRTAYVLPSSTLLSLIHHSPVLLTSHRPSSNLDTILARTHTPVPSPHSPSSASRVLARLRHGRDTRRSRQELGGDFGKPDRIGHVAQAPGRVYKGLQEGARRREACRVRRTPQGCAARGTVCMCVLRAICFVAHPTIDCLECAYGPTLIPSRYVEISLPTTGLSGRGRPAHSPVAVLGGRLHVAVQIAVRFAKGMKCLCILIHESTCATTTEYILLTHLHVPHTPGMRHPTRFQC